MNRRKFLTTSLAASAIACSRPPEPVEGKVLTVLGSVKPDTLGFTLAHEHLFSNFGGEPAEPTTYDAAALLGAVIPYLERLRGLGCESIVDATAAYFGRRPDLLRLISERSGIHILTNTGFYGAANDRYVPESAKNGSADEIAAAWVKEFYEGIGDTGIRPGFMKIGIDGGALSEIDAKLVDAAAIAHRETGLTVAVHTGGNPEAARQQLEILAKRGVREDAWIWVHANSAEKSADLIDAARLGAWISLDGIATESIDAHLAHLRALRDAGHLAQVLLSHDGNSFRATGRPPKAYETLFTEFLPRLHEEQWSDEEIRQLTEINPQRAYTIAKRLR